MGSSGRTWNDEQADAFFAQFVDALPEVVAAVAAERRGDAGQVVREGREFGYWARVVQQRAARRAERQRVEAAARMREVAAATRLAHPDERARLAAVPAESLALLPPVRVAQVTVAEREDSRRWWASLGDAERRARLGNRLRREARDAVEQQRVGLARARNRAERWRLDQRAFERAQWQAVKATQAERRRRRVEHQWAAISEQRALEIAIAALEHGSPPQAAE